MKIPLFPLQIFLFPGTLQPLNIIEPWAEKLIQHCLETMPTHQRYFGMIYENSQLLDNKIGILVKIINVYYGNTKGDRFVVLVR